MKLNKMMIVMGAFIMDGHDAITLKSFSNILPNYLTGISNLQANSVETLS